MPTPTELCPAIIACNAAAGFAGHLSATPVRWPLAAVFSLIAAAGVLLGGKFAGRVPERSLRRIFAVLVLLTAGFVVWQSLA